MKAPLTYTLKHPILLTTRSTEGVESDEELRPEGATIVLRRPKAKDMRVVDKFEGENVAITLALIERLTNLDAQQVENLDAEDMAGLGELVADFLPSGRRTGGTS